MTLIFYLFWKGALTFYRDSLLLNISYNALPHWFSLYRNLILIRNKYYNTSSKYCFGKLKISTIICDGMIIEILQRQYFPKYIYIIIQFLWTYLTKKIRIVFKWIPWFASCATPTFARRFPYSLRDSFAIIFSSLYLNLICWVQTLPKQQVFIYCNFQSFRALKYITVFNCFENIQASRS